MYTLRSPRSPLGSPRFSPCPSPRLPRLAPPSPRGSPPCPSPRRKSLEQRLAPPSPRGYSPCPSPGNAGRRLAPGNAAQQRLALAAHTLLREKVGCDAISRTASFANSLSRSAGSLASPSGRLSPYGARSLYRTSPSRGSPAYLTPAAGSPQRGEAGARPAPLLLPGIHRQPSSLGNGIIQSATGNDMVNMMAEAKGEAEQSIGTGAPSRHHHHHHSHQYRDRHRVLAPPTPTSTSTITTIKPSLLPLLLPPLSLPLLPPLLPPPPPRAASPTI